MIQSFNFNFLLKSFIFNTLLIGFNHNIKAQCTTWDVTIDGAAGAGGNTTANYVCDPNYPLNVKATPDFTGHATIVYTWSNGGSGQSISVGTPGIYSVTVTDNNGCTGTNSFEVFAGSAPSITATASPNPACPGQDVTVTVTGTFNMNWWHLQTDLDGYIDRPGMNMPPMSMVPPFTHSETWIFTMGNIDKKVLYQGHDDVGCKGAGSIDIPVKICSLSVSATGTSVKCKGGSDGTVTASASGASGAVTYAWSNGASGAMLNGVVANSYTVIAKDASNCTATTTYTVTEPTVIRLTCASTDVSNTGGSDGTVGVVASGGISPYGYLWSNNITTSTQTGLAVGDYSVIITDANNCTQSCTVTVAQPNCSISVSITGTNLNCNGDASGTAIATVSGAMGTVNYNWTTTETTSSIRALLAGVYGVTVSESISCKASSSITITEPTALSITCSNTSVTTTGGNNGTATVNVTGATAPYSYVWTGGATTSTASGLAKGTYEVTVTDANGCSKICSTQIIEPGCALVINGTRTNLLCNGDDDGTITISVTGANGTLSYLWDDGITTTNRTNLAADTYKVTVSESPSCFITATYTITEPDVIALTCSGVSVTTSGGNNGEASVIVSGGVAPYNYSWSNGGNTSTITGLIKGTYYLTVTDANGCTNTCDVLIKDPNCTLSATISKTNITCYATDDGTATVTPIGAFGAVTYLWSNNETTPLVFNLSPGDYSVTISESATCTTSISVTITGISDLSITCSAVSVTTTGGNDGSASVSASGGTPPYFYSWSNGGTASTITDLSLGTYYVTVTYNKICQKICESKVIEPGCTLLASITVTDVSCNGGSNGTATATASGATGALSYVWENNSTNPRRTGLSAGTYYVTVSESPNCKSATNIVITEPAFLNASCSATSVKSNAGNDGSAKVVVSGGVTPYTYLWSNGQTTTTITNLTSGTYEVTVTDANGCISTCNTEVIDESCKLKVELSGTDVNCFGGSNGSIVATATMGTGILTYLWSNAMTSTSITNISAGIYTVIVTQSATCSVEKSYTVVGPSDISLSCTSTSVTTSGVADGTATVAATGGTSPYLYLWTNGATIASITDLVAGTYDVTVTDANGCTKKCSSIVTEPDCTFTISANGTNVTCNGGANGSANVTVIGASGVSYRWSNNLTTAIISSLSAGQYDVTVSLSVTCFRVSSYTVTQPSDISLSCTSTSVTTSGVADGTATVAATGGTSPYLYLWSNGATIASITDLIAGTYEVTVTDANGCTKSCSSVVKEPNTVPTCPPPPGPGALSCSDSAMLAVPRYINGDAVAAGSLAAGFGGFEMFNYDNNGETGFNKTVPASQLGAVWGTAYKPQNNTIYTSAFLKRHVGFGPNGTGAIYKIDATQNTLSASLFMNLATAGVDVGANPRTPSVGIVDDANELTTDPSKPSWDVNAFALVGKNSLGDLDISEDGTTLWTINLKQKELIEIDIATATLKSKRVIPNPGCSGNDYVPFGLKVYNGKVWIGTTCTAQTSQNASDLKAYIDAWNGNSFIPVYNFSLNYQKGYTGGVGGVEGNRWYPWTDTYVNLSANPGFTIYPTPLVSDIEFDTDGSMIIGMMDRTGHQMGFDNYLPTMGSGAITSVHTGGDIIRVCNVNGEYKLEQNGLCPGEASRPNAPDGSKNSGEGNNQGPAGGEFYWGEIWNYSPFNPNAAFHQETSLGSLAFKPGSGEIVVTSLGPTNTGVSGGVIKLSNATGRKNSGYKLFDNNVTDYTLGKANGLGDIEVFCMPNCIQPTDIVYDVIPATAGNSDGKITFISVSNSDKYFINTGNVFSGTYATAIDIPAAGTVIQSNILNIDATYIIRFYNGKDNCYKDEKVVFPIRITTSACGTSSCGSGIGVRKL